MLCVVAPSAGHSQKRCSVVIQIFGESLVLFIVVNHCRLFRISGQPISLSLYILLIQVIKSQTR